MYESENILTQLIACKLADLTDDRQLEHRDHFRFTLRRRLLQAQKVYLSKNKSENLPKGEKSA